MTLGRWVLVFGFACGLATANAEAGPQDPPSRVARVAHVAGGVSLQNAGSDTFESAAVNWPVASGDRLRTATGARAEIGLGTATIRIDGNSDLTVVELEPLVTRIQPIAGTIDIELRTRVAGETFRLQFDRTTIELQQEGDYRVDVASDGSARVIVNAGQANVSTGVARFQQFTGEQTHIAQDGTIAIAQASDPDSFDHWRLDRTKARAGERTAPHVARGLVGYEELDSYGSWHWQRDYGMVWEPARVQRDWAPYRLGHWIHKPPWGWTWIDDAPWAFAPSHFGRWLQVRERWLWVPGPRQIPAVYAPAVVGWTRDPTGSEPADWFPLGPGEQYVPPYPASDRYVLSLNTFSIMRQHVASERSALKDEVLPKTFTQR